MDIKTLRTAKLWPMYSKGWDHRYNFDGFLNYVMDKDLISKSYVQLFKNGIIEAIEGAHLITPNGIHVDYEEEVIKSLSNYLSVLKTLNVNQTF